MTNLDKAIKSMDGKPMPVLIGGKNWWPESYLKAYTAALTAAVPPKRKLPPYSVIQDVTYNQAISETLEAQSKVAKEWIK